jgi:hypothetical protein
MPIKITNRTIKIHTDFYDFAPRRSLEKAEYEKAKITSVDEKPESKFSRQNNKQEVVRRAGDIGEPLTHWPYQPTIDEITWYNFLDKITDKNNKFYPARDEDRRPIPKTGAMHVITDLIRLKTGDNLEFLLSKGYVIGHDAAGEEVTQYLPQPERLIKTLFEWRSEANNLKKNF